MKILLLIIGLLNLFRLGEGNRYQEPTFQVETKSGIMFAEVKGYWTDMKDETPPGRKIRMMDQALDERTLDLRLDLYLPKNDTLSHRPLVMLMHGGSFYYGSRSDVAITKWCQHLASLGYVAASIDYREGYVPTMENVERAGYRAIQDAHAALRYLVAHRENYGIDTAFIFVGGSSAGAITALNLAFMTNETRPSSTYKSGKSRDLGNIETSGNNYTNHFSIKGIVDMWGALSDTSMMQGKNVPILAFHGDADDVVPYGYDYPFHKAGWLKKAITQKMFGSYSIVKYAKKHGQQARLYTFEGYGHSPHRDPDTKALNENFYFIQDKMSAFFFQIITSEKEKATN